MGAALPPLRIAFTPHAYHPAVGGTEHYTQGLAKALAHRGHGVHVVVPDIDDAEAFYELGHRATGRGDETKSGVSIRRIPYLTWGYRAASTLRLPAQAALDHALSGYSTSLVPVLEEIAPDVVVTLPHLFRNVPAAFAAASACGAAVVYAPFLHEADPNWKAEDVARYVQAAHGVIALTSAERRRLIEGYGATPSRIAEVPPAVSVPHESPVDERGQMVLFLGRLTASKRLEVLAETMQIVRERFPNVELVLAGARDKRWRPPEPTTGIRIIEDPSDGERDRLLASAMVFVNPSLTESFGITTLESWAQATPVVIPATPISESIVTDGVDGTLTAPDSASIATGIIDLLEDGELARRMGEAGQGVVVDRYSWEASADAFEALAEASLAQSTRRS